MRYYRFTTEEHARTEAGGELAIYYEVQDDGMIVRSLEVYDDGIAFSYDLEHPTDECGSLPDAEMDVAAAAEFGTISEITEIEFKRQWHRTEVANR